MDAAFGPANTHLELGKNFDMIQHTCVERLLAVAGREEAEGHQGRHGRLCNRTGPCGDEGVSLAQTMQVGPRISVRIQLQAAEFGPTSEPTRRLSHSALLISDSEPGTFIGNRKVRRPSALDPGPERKGGSGTDEPDDAG